MENTFDFDEQSGPVVPRRRSTFFVRRESIAPQPNIENVNPNVEVNIEADEKHKQALMRYSEQLVAEKDKWKKEVSDRQNKYHDLREQLQHLVQAPTRSKICYSSLSKEDIEFLKNKPNLSTYVDSQQKFHKSVQTTQFLMQRLNALENVTLRHCEKKVQEVIAHIFEHSTVDLQE